MYARNMLEQLLAPYTNPESQNAQRHRQTDGQTDGQQAAANRLKTIECETAKTDFSFAK